MKKIFFLYNNYERESTIIKLVCEELRKYKNVKVYLGGIRDNDICKKLLRVRPYIIFTFPITTQKPVELYTMSKVLFHTRIITYTTEGLLDYHDSEVIKTWAGFYEYPPTLVDYHTYWGIGPAKYIARELKKQNKVMKKEQIKIFGNPMYEKRYTNNYRCLGTENDNRIKVLVLSGFHLSLYSMKDCINANDIVNINGKTKKEILEDEVLQEIHEGVLVERIYCEKYIQQIIYAAEQNPDVLFLVKLHPQEILLKKNKRKIGYIEKLRGRENIKIIEQRLPIGVLLSNCDLLVHYGSTVDLESYIYKVPTLKLELRNVRNRFLVEANRLTESTYYEDIDRMNAISEYVDKLREEKELFHENEMVERQLYEYMNYEKNKLYEPSKWIADFLVGKLKYHTLKVTMRERGKWIMYAIKNTIKR